MDRQTYTTKEEVPTTGPTITETCSEGRRFPFAALGFAALLIGLSDFEALLLGVTADEPDEPETPAE